MFWVLLYEAVDGQLLLKESLKMATQQECLAAAQIITAMGRVFAFCVVPGMEI
jgi:hypothetical protein